MRKRSIALIIIVVGILSSALITSLSSKTSLTAIERTHAPAPYVIFVGLPNDGDHNELGYRGALPDTTHDEYRILMLGGSSVYGLGPLSEALPAQLERALRRGGMTDATVYNWGVVSSVSGMEVVTLLTRAVDYDPDLVVFFNGFNDIADAYLRDPRPGYPHNWYINEGTLQDVLRAQVGYGSEAWEIAVVDAYLGNMDRACHIGQAYAIPVLIVLQPSRVSSGLAVDDTEAATQYNAYQRRQAARLSEGLARLQSHYNEDNCNLTDASAICTGEARCVFTDSVHVSAATNEWIAEALAGMIAPP